MASIYKRSGSPFWWIKFTSNGKTKRESTDYRHAYPSETRKARIICQERTLEETKAGRFDGKTLWEAWVPQFMEERYRGKETTLKRNQGSWRAILAYFKERSILGPRQVDYSVCIAFMPWRRKFRFDNRSHVGHNHALSDLKFLSTVMGEAVRRGFIEVNTCSRLGIKKDKPKEKPEMTDEEISKIRDALNNPSKHFKDHKDWLNDEDRENMRIMFEIGIHQGCRLRETSVPISNIEMEKQTITFHAKGDKRFTTALHPKLIPILQILKKKGQSHTCTIPPNPSKLWWKFFRRLDLSHLCFHCTRVTVITRLCRADVSEAKARLFVGHASSKDSDVHRIYQRLKIDDLGACVEALRFPTNNHKP